MNVSLRPLEDRDLDTIYQQVTDPESVRMAAFTAEDQTDRRAFLNRMSRLRADTSVSYRVIDVDGAIAGTIASFRIDNQPEVTYWVDRTQWGKGIALAPERRLTRTRCWHRRSVSSCSPSPRPLRRWPARSQPPRRRLGRRSDATTLRTGLRHYVEEAAWLTRGRPL
jgi:hypothetical protein